MRRDWAPAQSQPPPTPSTPLPAQNFHHSLPLPPTPLPTHLAANHMCLHSYKAYTPPLPLGPQTCPPQPRLTPAPSSHSHSHVPCSVSPPSLLPPAGLLRIRQDRHPSQLPPPPYNSPRHAPCNVSPPPPLPPPLYTASSAYARIDAPLSARGRAKEGERPSSGEPGEGEEGMQPPTDPRLRGEAQPPL